MVVFPNAKINLGLDIIRRRDDGYHDLVTAMLPVGLCDVLEIVPSRTGADTLTLSGNPCNCAPQKNLVMRALAAMRRRHDFTAVDIYLRKIIPDGAGLGGGSSDAAFTLRVLNEMFRLGDVREELAATAADIGADCPFFIYNRPMICTGIGTVMHSVEIGALASKTLVIVKPPTGVSTAEAYSRVAPHEPANALEKMLTEATDPAEWRGRVKNDFEDSVFPRHPEIADVKRRLLDAGAAYAAMSGSGSAVFGIFSGGVPRLDFPGMAVFITTIL